MKHLGFSMLLFGASFACVPHGYTKQAILKPQLPKAYVQARGSSTGDKIRPAWWKAFNDPKLDQLVATALRSNLDIKVARERFMQTEALARQSGAAYWPKIEGQANAGRSQSISPFTQTETINNRFELSVAASYELDLWGKYRSQRAGALADVEATRNDLDSLAITISAQLSDAWYLLREQRSQHALLQEQTRVNETMLKLIEARFEQGLASALDVFQQRQQVIRTRRRLQPTKAQIVILQNQIALLLGADSDIQLPKASAELPSLPALPALGLPADLLKQRPDIRSARSRVHAADHRVASALADRFPSLRLSASGGLQAADLEDLVDNFIWSLAGGILMPIIDGGRRSAEHDRRKAVLRMALAQYKKSILVGVFEVENALIRVETTSAEVDELKDELQAAQSTSDEAQNRYLQGLSDYLPVLSALRSLQETQRLQLSAQRQLISWRIQLYRALGGGIAQSASGEPS
jgi:NodT family efflux transporter outer membrane factor (OMF) lipoprotein